MTSFPISLRNPVTNCLCWGAFEQRKAWQLVNDYTGPRCNLGMTVPKATSRPSLQDPLELQVTVLK